MVDTLPVDFIVSEGDERTVLESIIKATSDVDGYRAEWRDEASSVSLVRQTKNSTFPSVVTGHESGSPNRSYMLPSTTGVELRVFVDEFEIDDNVSERTELLLDLVLQIYTATEAVAYAYGLDTEHVGSLVEGRELGKPMTDESLAENRINEVSWLMLFGPELVAEYGLEWLLRAPAWKREELDDGAILLVTSPDPTDYEQFSEDRDILRTYFDGRGNDSQYTDRS